MVRFWLPLLLAATSLAQPQAGGSQPVGWKRTIAQDQIALFATPLRLQKSQWISTVLPLAGVTTVLVLRDRSMASALPNTPDQIRTSKRISHLGDLYTLGAGIGGAAIAGSLARKPQVVRTSALAGRSLISSTLLLYTMKVAAGRERPIHNEGDGRFWKGRDSFPSGHSMATWAVATTVARRPRCPKWLAITAYAIAGAVSLSRISANVHFPADVAAGGALGFHIGNRMARQP